MMLVMVPMLILQWHTGIAVEKTNLANKELALNCPKKSVEPDGHVSLHRLRNPACKLIVLDSNRRTTYDVVASLQPPTLAVNMVTSRKDH